MGYAYIDNDSIPVVYVNQQQGDNVALGIGDAILELLSSPSTQHPGGVDVESLDIACAITAGCVMRYVKFGPGVLGIRPHNWVVITRWQRSLLNLVVEYVPSEDTWRAKIIGFID